MGLADVPLMLVPHVPRVALALVVARTDPVEAGNIALWQALGCLTIPLEAMCTLADVRTNAASILAGLLADGLAAPLQLEVARLTSAMTRSRALSVVAAVADGLTAPIGSLAVALQALALVRGHTASLGTALLALRLAVLAAHGIQGVALPALALVALVAHSVATAQWTGGDALPLGRSHVAGNAHTRVGRRADSVGTIVRADRITFSIDVRIALVALAAHLNTAHIRGSAIANKPLPRITQK